MSETRSSLNELGLKCEKARLSCAMEGLVALRCIQEVLDDSICFEEFKKSLLMKILKMVRCRSLSRLTAIATYSPEEIAEGIYILYAQYAQNGYKKGPNYDMLLILVDYCETMQIRLEDVQKDGQSFDLLGSIFQDEIKKNENLYFSRMLATLYTGKEKTLSGKTYEEVYGRIVFKRKYQGIPYLSRKPIIEGIDENNQDVFEKMLTA